MLSAMKTDRPLLNNMDKSLSTTERKKPGMKEHRLFDSIFITFKHKQNESVVIEVRTVVTFGQGG